MAHVSLRNIWHFIQERMKQKVVRQVFYLLIVLLSLAFIGYTIYKNWNELAAQKWDIRWWNVLLATVLYPLGMLPTVAGWHKLLEALGVRKPFRLNLRLYALSSLPKHIPGLVWYVTSRTLLYQEQGVSIGIILAAIAAETALLALTGFILSVLVVVRSSAVFSQFAGLQVILPLAVILVLGVVLSTPMVNRISQALTRRGKLEQPLHLKQKELLLSVFWMLLAWCGGGVLLFILVQALTPLSWSYLPMMIGIWGVAGGVSLTIGIGISGMGLREVTLGALLSLVISPLGAIVVAVAFRLVLTVGEFLWVALIAWLIKTPPRKPEGGLEADGQGQGRVI